MMQSSHPQTVSLSAPYTIIVPVELFGQLASLLGQKPEHSITRKHGTMKITRLSESQINFEIIPVGVANTHVKSATGNISCVPQTIGRGKAVQLVRQCNLHVATGQITVPEFAQYVTSGLNAKKFGPNTARK